MLYGQEPPTRQYRISRKGPGLCPLNTKLYRAFQFVNDPKLLPEIEGTADPGSQPDGLKAVHDRIRKDDGVSRHDFPLIKSICGPLPACPARAKI
jgi:hypothetical protein